MGAQGESRSQITHRRATTMRAIAAILISPALIAAGYVVSWTMKQKDIQLEYVKQAIEIIRYSPTANVDELTIWSLNRYAIDILRQNSRVLIPPELEYRLLGFHKRDQSGPWTTDISATLTVQYYVSVDGHLIGRTPMKANLAPGNHVIGFIDDYGTTIRKAAFAFDGKPSLQVVFNGETGRIDVH